MPPMIAAEPSAHDRADVKAKRPPLLLGQLRRGPHREHDRDGREEPRHDRDDDGRPDPDRGDEENRQERPADRAQVVHRTLEPVGAPVGGRGDEIGE